MTGSHVPTRRTFIWINPVVYCTFILQQCFIPLFPFMPKIMRHNLENLTIMQLLITAWPDERHEFVALFICHRASK